MIYHGWMDLQTDRMTKINMEEIFGSGGGGQYLPVVNVNSMRYAYNFWVSPYKTGCIVVSSSSHHQPSRCHRYHSNA